MVRIANSRQISLVLAALLLRALIPDSYMPAAAGTGLLFELCPSRMPAEFMQALQRSEHGHHHHGSSDDTTTHYDASQCPIGHLLSVAVAFDDFAEIDTAQTSPVPNETPLTSWRTRTPLTYRSRGPPA
jgi:hypothetical protein